MNALAALVQVLFFMFLWIVIGAIAAVTLYAAFALIAGF